MRNILALAAAATLAGSAYAATVEVFVFNFDFSVHMPATGIIEDPVINVGDTVRWIWLGGLHSVTSLPSSAEVFDSGLLTPPGTFEHTFMNPGDFMYHCIIHSEQHPDGHFTGMVGMVSVVPAPAGAGLAGLALFAGLRRRR